MTTDPALPYVIWSGFGASPGFVNHDLEAFLADRPHTIVRREITVGWNEPVYSPDGKYYINGRPFDDPTGLGGRKPAMFSADGQEIAYGYKYGWHQIFLGWAYDSSGAYFVYQPATPDGDALYQKWPLYKVLVPGALLRGTPAPASTPTSFSGGSPSHTFNAAQVHLAAYRPALPAQAGSEPGWYIDDVSVFDAAAPSYLFYDDFEWPNSTDLGPYWEELVGDWGIQDGQLHVQVEEGSPPGADEAWCLTAGSFAQERFVLESRLRLPPPPGYAALAFGGDGTPGLGYKLRFVGRSLTGFGLRPECTILNLCVFVYRVVDLV